VKFLQLVFRGARLRCPRCGEGRLYASYTRMNPQCGRCGFPFRREDGFYLGAIYFNYGLTALILTVAYPLLVLSGALTPGLALAAGMLFAIAFPLLFFRYARSLWLGFDEFVDPRPR
jgi:uncharacterized protein (DUF983 family)